MSKPVIIGLLEEIAAQAPNALEATCAAMPKGFPAQIIDSVAAAIDQRVKLLSVL